MVGGEDVEGRLVVRKGVVGRHEGEGKESGGAGEYLRVWWLGTVVAGLMSWFGC